MKRQPRQKLEVSSLECGGLGVRRPGVALVTGTERATHDITKRRQAAALQNSVLRQLTSLITFLLTVVVAVYAEQLPLKSYRTTDGLLSDTINSIVQDSRGFIWFGTSFGLSRFDGYGFTHYSEKDGLSYPNVNRLIETRDGSYWVCTNGGGVFRFQPNGEAGSRFKVYPVGDQPATKRVNDLFEDRGGSIWVGTDAGLFRLDKDGGKFLPVALGVPSHAEQEMQVWAFAEDGEGSLWIGTKFGLVRRLSDGSMLHYSLQPLAS